MVKKSLGLILDKDCRVIGIPKGVNYHIKIMNIHKELSNDVFETNLFMDNRQQEHCPVNELLYIMTGYILNLFFF